MKYVKRSKSSKAAEHLPFARILIELMAERSMSVREAARIAGVAPSTITSWRSNAKPEDFIAVRKLAHALGVTMSYLLTGEDDSRPSGQPAAISEVFVDGGALFDGFAKITIQRLIPKTTKGNGQ